MSYQDISFSDWQLAVREICDRLLGIDVDSIDDIDMLGGYVEHETPEQFFVAEVVQRCLEDISVSDLESVVFYNALWGKP